MLVALATVSVAISSPGNGFYEQNNNSARATCLFVHFFSVPAQLRCEMNKFWVDLRKGAARNALPSLQFQLNFSTVK